jgi:glycosyltransferase involved in cell wall biosynthesis
MNGTGSPVTHVVGRDRPGDPVAASARALATTLDRRGRPGRLVTAADLAGGDGLDGQLVVHSSDGGEALVGALPQLVDRTLTLVHHGSAVGADRSALRALRTPTTWAVGVDPVAREELRGMGFRTVAPLPALLLDDPFDDVEPDEEAAAHLRAHPGPAILHVGPLVPNRSLEELLDAFTELVTHRAPGATLSLCGPSPSWYLAQLRRRISAQGLRSCELLEPSDDGQVLARLDRADVVVALPPAGLDPYLRRAARAGVPIVAPRMAAAAGLDPEDIVEVGPRAHAGELAQALEDAIERGRQPAGGPAPAADPRLGTLVHQLGLR